jgi:hypothetical protein
MSSPNDTAAAPATGQDKGDALDQGVAMITKKGGHATVNSLAICFLAPGILMPCITGSQDYWENFRLHSWDLQKGCRQGKRRKHLISFVSLKHIIQEVPVADKDWAHLFGYGSICLEVHDIAASVRIGGDLIGGKERK